MPTRLVFRLVGVWTIWLALALLVMRSCTPSVQAQVKAPEEFRGILFRVQAGAVPPAGAVYLFADRYRLDGADLDRARQDGTLSKVALDAEPNPMAYAIGTPTDPLAPQQYSLSKLQIASAHDITQGAGVKVAIVDSGVDCGHPDLTGQCLPGRSFVSGASTPDDDHGHGTHVAGIVAAACNAIGTTGIACQAKVIPTKVLDRSGGGDYGSIAAGIAWAADQGAKVINLSLGGRQDNATLREAVQYATRKGSLLVCAAGNDGQPYSLIPAAYPECVSVVATDQSDNRAGFSNYGRDVDISAPGVDVLSTVRGGRYEAWDGTSMASPNVAGVAALVAAVHPDWGPDRIRDALQIGADDLGSRGRDDQFGYGRVNALRALGQTPNGPTVTPGPSPRPFPTLTPNTPPSVVGDVIRLTNGERAARGLAGYREDTRLDRAAQAYADLMAQTGCWGHYCGDTDPWQRIRNSGYPMATMYGGSENIAKGYRDAAAAVAGWMASTAGHRENLLSTQWIDVGCGYTPTGQGAPHYVCLYAKPDGSAPAPTARPAPSPTPTRRPGGAWPPGWYMVIEVPYDTSSQAEIDQLYRTLCYDRKPDGVRCAWHQWRTLEDEP